ncbi:MFS transporter [Oceanobacillus jeddahense]|uniref:MFS transporter n=1 Tax=Oceanobacillus jeddahense TaxID=1462527 RepID=A0ABY5JQ18_9BACI|nr:MFS transporter [Oceanobacillus jeddahense]UUI01181.1 MFS transporter [Oceanobacillus jeddahense]
MKKILSFLKEYKWIFTGSFLRLWSGVLASQVASLLFYFSLIWWSIEVLGSPLHGGILIGAGTLVTVLAAPLTGWMADRFHRGRLIVLSDIFTMIGFLFMSLFAFIEIGSIWPMYVVRILISIVNAPVNPAFRSLLPEVVDDKNLEKAVAFQGSIMQGNQVIIPIVAGGLTVIIPYPLIWTICASLTGFSAIWEMFIRDQRGSQSDIAFKTKQLSRGFKRLFKNQPLRLLAISSGLDQFVFSGFPIYIAVWSLVVLQGQTLTAGSLQTFWAVGVLSTSVFMTFLANQKHIKRGVTFFSVILGLSFLSVVLFENFWYSCMILLIAGGSSGIINVYLEGFLQRASTGKDKGRTLSAFMAINSALVPLGYAVAGWLSELVNPVWLIAMLAAPAPITIWTVRKAITIWEQEQQFQKAVNE